MKNMHYSPSVALLSLTLESMHYFKSALIAVALVALILVPSAPAHAQSAYTTAQLQAQIQLLLQQLAQLQAQVAALKGGTLYYDSTCYYSYCTPQYRTDIDEIEVDFVGDVAQVRVEFDDRDTKRYALYADTVREVAEGLATELSLPASTIERLIDVVNGFDDDDDHEDIRRIDVTFEDDDADVVVRFRDGDTDRFTLRNVDEDEDEVIEEIADRYHEDEDDIEDVIDFEYEDDTDSDIRRIDVDFYSDDAHITVYFFSGRIDTITLTNVDDDEDEVIEYLADRYNERERDIDDVIDFDY